MRRRSGAGPRSARLALVLGCCVAASLTARGQTMRTGGDNARAIQQLQQLASERTALQADNAKLKEQVEDLKKKLDRAAAENAALAARKTALEADGGAGQSGRQTSEALEKSRAQMQELIGRFRETALNLKTVETERAGLRAQLEARSRDYDTCVDRNAGLYQINLETLAQLEKQGFWRRAGEVEPFTRLARTRLENLIDDYRFRVDELRVQRAKAPAVAVKGP